MSLVQTEYSYSGLQDFSACQKRRFFSTSADHVPLFQKPALLIGGAAHQAVKELHENPGLDIPQLCEDNLNLAITRRENIPVAWGKGDPVENRQKRLDVMIETVETYWERNCDVSLISSERWAWLPFMHESLGNVVTWIKLRFDQLRYNENGEVTIWELKMGKTSPVKLIDPIVYDDDGYYTGEFNASSLERDDQCILQAVAFANGYIAMQDMDYISATDERWHQHVFEPVGDPNDGICKCLHCPPTYKFQKFQKGWPAAVVRYHPYGHVPLKSGSREGEERFPTKYEITWDLKSIEIWAEKTAARIMQYQEAMRAGCWLPTGKTGFMGACDDCEYTKQCESKVCTVRVRK